MENIGIVQYLDGARRMLKSSILPVRRELSMQIQAQIALELQYEKLLLQLDEMMQLFNVSSLNREVLMDFMELRDLTTKQIYDLKRTIENNKNLVATFDKVIFWTDKKL